MIHVHTTKTTLIVWENDKFGAAYYVTRREMGDVSEISKVGCRERGTVDKVRDA